MPTAEYQDDTPPMRWFDSYIGPKEILYNGRIWKATIGFEIESDGEIVGRQVESEGHSMKEAIEKVVEFYRAVQIFLYEGEFDE